jgi:hypothetical protein
MNLILRRAGQRGETSTAGLRALVARLPVNVLHSELGLGAALVSDQHIADIVDELFLPLAAPHPR